MLSTILCLATACLGQLSPNDAQKKLVLPPGLRAELVASEPHLESPVHASFDPQGNLWVVEMRDYPNGPKPGEKSGGRIRILRDKDGDGFFESSSIFADNLLFANGLIHWRDGVIVTAAPHIIFLRDTDGDGVCDQREILFEGFATQNPQLRVSHPILGPDGWITVANGLRGGSVIRSGDPKAEPVNLSGMDFRFDPVTFKHEAVSGMGQFGNAFDDWGNRFVCDNRHHLRHVVMENRYLKRNPHLAAPAVLNDVSELTDGPLNSGSKVFPLSKNWTTSSLHVGQFTAACGIHIYRGNLLPEKYQGAALTCDPTGNLVHLETLTPSGATFVGKPLYPDKEFLASPDDWFRPVSMTTGPDGALYVVDMSRAVIEHPEFMPAELKNQPDLLKGRDMGRVWRIVPEGYKHKAFELPGKTPADWASMLDHPNAWQRLTAQRQLMELKNPISLPPCKTPQGQIARAWLLERWNKLDDKAVEDLLDADHPAVREAGIRIAESRPRVLLASLGKLAADASPRVKFQAALSAGELGKDLPLGPLATLVQSSDPWTRQAVYSSVSDRASELLTKVALPNAQKELAMLVGARQDPAEIVSLLKSSTSWQSTILLGLTEGMGRRGVHFQTFLEKLGNPEYLQHWKASLGSPADLAKLNNDDLASFGKTIFPLFAHANWDVVQKQVTSLWDRDLTQDTRLSLVRALSAHNNPQATELLMRDWRAYSPAVRREVAEAMLRRPERIEKLLDAIAAKTVKAGDLDPLRTKQLINHTNLKIRERATQLLKDSLPGDRKEALAKYQAVFKIAGEPKRGIEIFKKNCAACHRLQGVGNQVGPDIGDTRVKTPEALLIDILSPNQAIDANYVQYLVITKSGKSMTGILANETSASITLKRAEGQSDIVLRSDIEEISSTGVSLMPDGMEKNITIEEMADLIAYLKNWRYLQK